MEDIWAGIEQNISNPLEECDDKKEFTQDMTTGSLTTLVASLNKWFGEAIKEMVQMGWRNEAYGKEAMDERDQIREKKMNYI